MFSVIRAKTRRDEIAMVTSRHSASLEPTQSDYCVQVSEESDIPRSQIDPHVGGSGDAYDIGDIYEEQLPSYAQEWEIDESERPYLRYVKEISKSQRCLKYLANWMQVSTTPVKWKFLKKEHPCCRAERASRTKIAILTFNPDKDVDVIRFNDVAPLSCALGEQAQSQSSDVDRLVVVEDLSRDVVELLGTKFAIDPMFFREHLNDYMWYNTRDPWVQLPDLKIVSRARSFFSMRYYHARYFRSRESFEKARTQAGSFNVLRRLDDTMNQHSHFDAPGSVVGLVRCKASLWICPNRAGKGGSLGILLLDPTLKDGYPLWGGCNTFEGSPSLHASTHQPGKSIFEDLIYWTRKLPKQYNAAITEEPIVMAFYMFQIICAEWIVISAYITTRLSQTEWELGEPKYCAEPSGIQSLLNKLHHWHRTVPIYRSMLLEMQANLFRDKPLICAKDNEGCLSQLRDDIENACREMGRLMQRIEHIITLSTATASIEEGRRAIKQNRQIQRLTYLAAIFVPLSFISSLFSMTPDLSLLRQTFLIYFIVSIPLIIIIFSILDFRRFQKSLKR